MDSITNWLLGSDQRSCSEPKPSQQIVRDVDSRAGRVATSKLDDFTERLAKLNARIEETNAFLKNSAEEKDNLLDDLIKQADKKFKK